MKASKDVASVEASVEAFLGASVEVAPADTFVKASVEDASVKAYVEDCVEVATVDAFVQASWEFLWTLLPWNLPWMLL